MIFVVAVVVVLRGYRWVKVSGKSDVRALKYYLQNPPSNERKTSNGKSRTNSRLETVMMVLVITVEGAVTGCGG